MFVGDREKPFTNPGPLAAVDYFGTCDVKSPGTLASKIAGVGSMLETSRELMP